MGRLADRFGEETSSFGKALIKMGFHRYISTLKKKPKEKKVYDVYVFPIWEGLSGDSTNGNTFHASGL